MVKVKANGAGRRERTRGPQELGRKTRGLSAGGRVGEVAVGPLTPESEWFSSRGREEAQMRSEKESELSAAGQESGRDLHWGQGQAMMRRPWNSKAGKGHEVQIPWGRWGGSGSEKWGKVYAVELRSPSRQRYAMV